ncbi:unnamed protein product [Prunus armeniaca]|uniref:peroxidase n=2 Tax=Prunus armeniaca TaxID=36596 RepID=A0A6J5UEF8_PRUAR|nr:hypothetical protein GBA52_011006 [Prunus armeniaca]CAB4274027.1 unnamed protein product [Prunus armeniaca]
MEFSNHIFNFSKSYDIDPTNPNFAQGSKKLCAVSTFNDIMSPAKFDNMYFRNLQRGLGLLSTIQALMTDWRMKPLVDL